MDNSPNHENIQEDIAYIKSMIHRTQRVIDPGAYFFIMWGVIIIIGNGVIPLINPGFLKMYWIIVAPTAAVLSSLFGAFMLPKPSCLTLLSKQIGLLWATFGLGAMLLLFLAFFFPQQINGIQLGLLIYILMAITLCATGIIYMSEYYLAGVIIFIAAILSYFYPTIIAVSFTGFLAGGSMVILGVLALIRLRKAGTDVAS